MILMFDHSPTNIGSYTNEYLKDKKVPFIISGVASFDADPFEKLFALFKKRFRR